MPTVLIAGLPGHLGSWLAPRIPGSAVQAVFSGEEVLDTLRTRSAQLVVLDSSLEEPSAEDVIRRIRADPQGTVPIIYTMDLDAGAVDEERLRKLVQDLRVDQLLFHPVDRSELLRVVTTLLGITPTEATFSPEGPAAASPGTGSSSAAHEKLGQALAAVWQRARGPILDRVTVIDRAVEAIRGQKLNEALREEARREAHRLAGALGTFGLDQGSVRAREIEETLERMPLYAADAVRISELAAQIRREVNDRGVAPAVTAAAVMAPPVPNDPPIVWVESADQALGRQVRTELLPHRVLVWDSAAAERSAGIRPDAVFLDLRAQEEEAEWDAFARVAERAPSVPVVVYTERETLLDRVRALKMGARLILHPPLDPGAVATAVIQTLPVTGAEPQRILTVDDDSTITEGLRALLEPQGFRVRTLNDPLRFWTELRGARPDLLVLDVDMPHLNGIELCRVVRSDPEWRSVPILFLTARQDRETIYRVFAAGADDYLSKPIVGPELVSRIRNRLDRRR